MTPINWGTRPRRGWAQREAAPLPAVVRSGGTIDVATRILPRVGEPLDEPLAPITLSALPRPVHLLAYRGDDFAFSLVVHDADGETADLSGIDVTAQVRVEPDGQYLGEFDPSIDDNVIALRLHHETSATLPQLSAWDCQLLVDEEWVTTVVAGTISLTPDVTRP